MTTKVHPVSLPGGWPEDSSPRSAFLGLAPLGVSGDSFEDLASYFRRLGELHLMRPWTLAFRSVAPMIVGMSLTSRSHLADSCYGLSMNGVTEHAAKWVEALSALTLRNDLHLRTLLPLRDIVPALKLLSQTERYCPLCYSDDECNKRPRYNRLLWSLGCVQACPIHHVLLLEVGSLGSDEGRPFFLPGVSRLDGSSLAGEETGPATCEQSRMARMAADLLDDVHHHPDVFAGNCNPAPFLRFATDTLFGGVAMNFAQHLGVGKGELSNWMNGNVRPSLPRLLLIAYCCGCAVSDVILGNKVMLRRVTCSSTPAALTPRRRNGAGRPKEVLLTELQAIVHSGAVRNASEAADHLGVSDKHLRRLAPTLQGMLVQRGAESRRTNTVARREYRFGEFNRSFSALAAENGFLPSRRAVHQDVLKRTGIQFRFAEAQEFLRRAHTLVNTAGEHAMRRPSAGRPKRGNSPAADL
ncbi:TniQ family protein [Paraburkholderia youngii]|uniref:Transcriptional regulator with XRE-family HTH domain n=1 Tax=Paraburkholderia youngii TaxID=2782701 RepID=A0A7W8P0T8_9BURK|nr:TniQ family protein [Paraburkholderia youngii]MBB5400529.1 transcriptional regulator with XRE-family HTH domain [Paraburkholderia youngii]